MPDVGNSVVALRYTGLAAKLRKRGEVQHKKEWHEVDGDQHQGKDGLHYSVAREPALGVVPIIAHSTHTIAASSTALTSDMKSRV